MAKLNLRPSSAPRFTRCPGSVKLSMAEPGNESGFAAEGTAAHQLRSECLSLGLDPSSFLGQTLRVKSREVEGKVWDFKVGAEMVRFLTPGIDLINEAGGVLYVEKFVDLSRWLPGQGGTLDCGIILPDLIVIDDLKYGQGTPVSPVENEQLVLYALGFWDNIARHETAATDFLLRIDQPRCAGGGGEWRTTLDELLDIASRIVKAAEEAASDSPTFCAGKKQCLDYFCPGSRPKGSCEEYARFNLDLIGATFDDLDDGELIMPSLGEMTSERKAFVVRNAKMISTWLETLHADVLNDALAGRPTPGLKAVHGRRGPRQWSNKVEAEGILKGIRLKREEMYNFVLISPTDAEKLLAEAKPRVWKKAQALITQSDPKPVLVPEDDKREAVRTISDTFEDDDDLI